MFYKPKASLFSKLNASACARLFRDCDVLLVRLPCLVFVNEFCEFRKTCTPPSAGSSILCARYYSHKTRKNLTSRQRRDCRLIVRLYLQFQNKSTLTPPMAGSKIFQENSYDLSCNFRENLRNVNLWTSLGPYFLMAFIWARVPYPLWTSKP